MLGNTWKRACKLGVQMPQVRGSLRAFRVVTPGLSSDEWESLLETEGNKHLGERQTSVEA